MGIRAREALGSPGMAGDNGEDDGMALDYEPRAEAEAREREAAFSSIVDSAEKRDKVSMVFDNNRSVNYGDRPRKRAAKSAVAGNFLRVRSTSGTTKPNGYGVGRDSVVSNAVNNPKEHFDYFYKVIVIGDECVGKTNFLLRMVHGFYDPKPKTTYGVEYETKTVQLPDSNQSVKAQVWDTSGARQFLSITTTHYRFAVGAFLVYDVTNIQSFINLRDWLHKIREFSDAHVVIGLVANKADLVEDDDKMKGYGRFAHRGDNSADSNQNYSNLVQDTEEDNENSHDRRSRRDQQRNQGNYQSTGAAPHGSSPRRLDHQYQNNRYSPTRPAGNRNNHQGAAAYKTHQVYRDPETENEDSLMHEGGSSSEDQPHQNQRHLGRAHKTRVDQNRGRNAHIDQNRPQFRSSQNLLSSNDESQSSNYNNIIQQNKSHYAKYSRSANRKDAQMFQNSLSHNDSRDLTPRETSNFGGRGQYEQPKFRTNNYQTN